MEYIQHHLPQNCSYANQDPCACFHTDSKLKTQMHGNIFYQVYGNIFYQVLCFWLSQLPFSLKFWEVLIFLSSTGL